MAADNDCQFVVQESSFESLVIEASLVRPVMVDFWAQWCAPCLHLAPVLDRVMATECERVRLAKLEVDDNMRVAGRYRIKGFPSVLLFVDGLERARFAGAKPLAFVQGFLDEHLPD